MGEIVQIQVGRCGNRVGNRFWKTVSDEHGLDERGRFVGRSADVQLDRINVYYEETSKQTYAPRAVLVGLDATATATADGPACRGASPRPDTVVTGRGCGTAGLWPRGYYAADDVPGRVLDAARSLAERCDRLQGFQVVHSLAGGTGSGLGARVADDLGAAFPGRALVAYAVAPDAGPHDAGPYNATMCAARLADGAHCTYVLDNRSLRRDAGRAGAVVRPAYSDLNRAAARAMSGVTATARFAATAAVEGWRPDACLRKSVTELVPYPAMRFLVPGFAALSSPPPPPWGVHAPAGVAARLLAAVAASPDGRAVVVAAAITFRHAPGRDGPGTATAGRRTRDALRPEDYRRVRPWRFRWSPDTVKTAGCDVPARGHRAGAAVAANTTAVCDVLERACRGARSATVSRAFADHGVTADELHEARERVRTLVDHYRGVQAESGYDVCDDDDDDGCDGSDDGCDGSDDGCDGSDDGCDGSDDGCDDRAGGEDETA